MGHKLNDISLNVERMNEYLFLNPDGTRSAHEQAPDLGNGVLNQMMTYIVRISNSLEEFKNDMREFKDEMEEFIDEMGEFKDEMGEFKDEMGEFKDEMKEFRIETNRRLANLEMSNKNLSSRFDNQFKGRGGNRNSPDAYDPISNSDYRTLADAGVSPLTSLAQIEQLTRGLNSYLEFYKLLTTGLVQDKRERLIRYIGANAEPERTYGRKI